MPRWINLRRHIRGLTRGDSITVSQGKWIVLRVFRVGQYSQYWDPNRKEAIGGPKWLYDDILVRSVSRPGSLVSLARAAKGMPVRGADPLYDVAGLDDPSQKLYAVEVTPDLPRIPEIGDRVYEIAEDGLATRPQPPLHATAMYDVLGVVIEHGDHGRAETFYVYGQKTGGES